MKINKNKKTPINKYRLVIASILLGLLLASAAVYVSVRIANESSDQQDVPDEERQPTINLNPPTQDQIDSAQQIKEDSVNQSETPQAPKEELAVTITAKNQNNSASTLQIRTLISSTVANGTCTLTLTKGDTVVTLNAGIQSGPSDSTCQGFDVPLSQLSTGQWSIKINVNSGSASGKATSEVSINVT